MAWENIEERLKKAFTVEAKFPNGIVAFPARPLDISDWLMSVAETDEELRELNIPRIRFLQNRWPVEKLLQFEWEQKPAIYRTIWVMYVGNRAYILISGGGRYYAAAAF